MTRTLLILLLTASVGGGAFVMGVNQQPTQTDADPVQHQPSTPRIEQVRALASLITLDVPITDLHVSTLEGVTGGMKVVVSVYGDVQVMTDLENAHFDEIDPDRQEAVLVLPRPEAQRPRLDHDKTRIVQIQRTGLWRLAPGGGGDQAQAVTNRAMAEAQRVLGEVADDENLIARACAQTEQVMDQFFNALGWSVLVRWHGGEAAEATAGGDDRGEPDEGQPPTPARAAADES